MWMHFAIAAAAGHLGLAREGAEAAATMAALAPPLGNEAALREFVSRWYWDPDLIELLLDGVRRAKASAPDGPPRTQSDASRVQHLRHSTGAHSVHEAPPPSAATSADTRTTAGLRVAVLPFTAR